MGDVRVRRKPYHWTNTALFYYLLAVLVWAPLPLAVIATGRPACWRACC